MLLGVFIAITFLICQVHCELPDLLTEKTFDQTVQDGNIHIIEFFSPYCIHCQQLAPIWNETVNRFQEEYEDVISNVKFSQVNCIESGDLCSREKIRFFPNIRIYTKEEGYAKDYPEGYERTVEGFIKYATELSGKEYESKESVGNKKPDVKSIPLTTTEFINLLSGKMTESVPYLVSFWPAQNMKSMEAKTIFEDCHSCIAFQEDWKKTSILLAAENIQAAHVNCYDSPEICEELGFQDLVPKRRTNERSPKIALVIPTKTSNSIFIYDGPISEDLNKYIDFAKRTYHNSMVPAISVEKIKQIVTKPLKLSLDSYDSTLDTQKLHLVFAYNPSTVVPEDFHILEYLIEPLSKIPNLYLYQSEDDIKTISHEFYLKMYEIINYNSSEPEKQVNEDFFILNSITEYPTFFLFRDGDYMTSIFPGLSSTEMRDEEYIMSWVRDLATNLMTGLTETNVDTILKKSSKTFSTAVILFVDSSTREAIDKSNEAIHNTLVAAYGYENVRMQEFVQAIDDAREQKQKKVKQLKEKNASSKAIINASSLGIVYRNEKKVLLTYVDIATDYSFLAKQKIGSRGNDYRVGDIMIINRHSDVVYDFNEKGDIITSESPQYLRDVLSMINGMMRMKPVTEHGSTSSSTDSKQWIFLLSLAPVVLLMGLRIKQKTWRRRYNRKSSSRNIYP